MSNESAELAAKSRPRCHLAILLCTGPAVLLAAVSLAVAFKARDDAEEAREELRLMYAVARRAIDRHVSLATESTLLQKPEFRPLVQRILKDTRELSNELSRIDTGGN